METCSVGSVWKLKLTSHWLFMLQDLAHDLESAGETLNGTVPLCHWASSVFADTFSQEPESKLWKLVTLV